MPDYDYSQEPDPRSTEFVIGVADQLQITVWENDRLSSNVRVRPDGTITIPLVGNLRALGRTPTELQKEIQKRLSAYVKETAIVTVSVTAVNSYRFTVQGEAQMPGMLSSDRYVTFMEAIALAGGFTRFARTGEIYILRQTKDGTLRKIPISYDAIVKHGREDMNIVILAGDRIHIP